MESSATLYYNATIHTMVENEPPAEALLVENGIVSAVGSRADVATAGGVRQVDLDGATIVPGFNDCHCHVLSMGMNLQGLDVSRDTVRSIADVQRAVRSHAEQLPAGSWIVGNGYDQNALLERRHPTRWEIDEATGGRPAVLYHTSGHVLVANTAAVEIAGISAGTADPAGGEIDRNESGEPTGLLKEAAMVIVGDAIPPPTIEMGTAAILAAAQHMARFGITSATDLRTGSGPSIEPQLEMYRRALASGDIAVRIGLCPEIRFVAPPDGDEVQAPDAFDVGDEPDWLSISAAKIFSDGAMSTRTAALRQGYTENPSNHGILLWKRDMLADMMQRAHGAGWQIATHALGDRAVQEVLSCYREVLTASPRNGHRHRIEHCMVLDTAMVQEMRDLGIVPVIQPDIHRLGDGYVAALGIERASQVIPMRLFDDSGVTFAFSSDAPVIPCDPLEVIRSAMERRTPEGVLLGREHAVPAMEAIRYYTAGGAFATRTDQRRGRLAPRMLADFAVLSADPAAVPPEDFHTITVLRTIAGGRQTFG